jgi:cytochrome P450
MPVPPSPAPISGPATASPTGPPDRADDPAPPSFTFDDATFQDPHPAYARLRAEDPVRPVILPSGIRVWLLTRYDDVRTALADRRLSKDVDKAAELLARQAPGGGDAHVALLTRHMLNVDPPEHTRLRRLMARAFTPGRVERLRPRIATVTEDLLDAMDRHDEVDLIAAFGFPLPLTVICELFGVPEADRADLHTWTSLLVTDSASLALTSDARSAMAREAAQSIAVYLSALILRKHEEPGDDLLSALVEAREDGETLDHAGVVSMAFLTIVAGHETVANLIGNGTLALLTHPEQLAALRADRSRLAETVEELLRYDGPANSAMLRHTLEPVSYSDVDIPAGEFVLPLITSANRDADRFTAPDRLDPRRPSGGHLTFGHGIHYCIGAPLARLEAEIAFDRLLTRFPRLRLAVDPAGLWWNHSTLVRGLTALPVRLH